MASIFWNASLQLVVSRNPTLFQKKKKEKKENRIENQIHQTENTLSTNLITKCCRTPGPEQRLL